MFLYIFVLKKGHAKILTHFFKDQKDCYELYEYDNGYLFAFNSYSLWTLADLVLVGEKIFHQTFE